jgi:hypothetical protein
MKILGINISHDFSICVYENKKIKEIYFEERFIRKKHWFIKKDEIKNLFILSIFKKINFKPDVVVYSSFQRTLEHDVSDIEIIEKIQKQWDVKEVCGLVESIGFAEAADVIKKECFDGKTLISANFDQRLTMGIAEGGLGLKWAPHRLGEECLHGRGRRPDPVRCVSEPQGSSGDAAAWRQLSRGQNGSGLAYSSMDQTSGSY